MPRLIPQEEIVWEDPPSLPQPIVVPQWVYTHGFKLRRGMSNRSIYGLKKVAKFFNFPDNDEGLYKAWVYQRRARENYRQKHGFDLPNAQKHYDNWITRADRLPTGVIDPELALRSFATRMGRVKKQPLLSREQLFTNDLDNQISLGKVDYMVQEIRENCVHRREQGGYCYHCGLKMLNKTPARRTPKPVTRDRAYRGKTGRKNRPHRCSACKHFGHRKNHCPDHVPKERWETILKDHVVTQERWEALFKEEL